METLVVVFIFALVVALGIALQVAAVKRRAERRRAEALKAWAGAHGWQFLDGDRAAGWRWRLQHLRGFRIRRLVCGVAGGLPVTVADCRYETHSAGTISGPDGSTQTTVNTHEHNLVVSVARLPGVWPDIEVAPRGVGSKILRALGRRDRTEPGIEEFDRRFKVESSDPQAATRLLSPALVRAHMANQLSSWSLRGGELLVVEKSRLQAGEVSGWAERLRWLANLLGAREVA